MMPEGPEPERRQLSNGKWIACKDVPLKIVINDAESWIESHVEEGRRSEVWYKTHEGLPSQARTPNWDIPPPNPNQRPSTPYSASRANPAPSNAELIDALAKAVNQQDMDHVAASIVWADSYSGESSGFLSRREGKLKVSGGRLGRDHTLEDVPNNYVRDRLMGWIQEKVPEQERRIVQRAVFNDLSDGKLDAYSECIRTQLAKS